MCFLSTHYSILSYRFFADDLSLDTDRNLWVLTFKKSKSWFIKGRISSLSKHEVVGVQFNSFHARTPKMSNKMKFWAFDSCKAKQIVSHKKYQFQFTVRCNTEKNNAVEIMRENRFASIVIVTWNSSYNNWIFCQSDGGVNWKGNSCQLLFQCIIIFFIHWQGKI